MLCPFCQAHLENSIVHCPENKKIPCLECKECHSYFYNNKNYLQLKDFAKKIDKTLNSNVYFLHDECFIEPPKNNTKILSPNLQNTKSLKLKKRYQKRALQLNKSKGVLNAPTRSKTDIKSIDGYELIILTNIRKCINKDHVVNELEADIKVALPDGSIGIASIPAVYCNKCKTYYAYKADFYRIKKYGRILCRVDDYTDTSTKKDKFKSKLGGESIIHRLGYNVISHEKNTDKQRKTVLANILEYSNIPKQEILNIIRINIARHESRPNYSKAVARWRQDYEFVLNYKKGSYDHIFASRIRIGMKLSNTTYIPVYYQNQEKSKFSTKEFQYNDIPPETDFAYIINDDSMEPTLQSNQCIFIRNSKELTYGDIGVFLLNNRFICREFHKEDNGEIRLFPHNRSYNLINPALGGLTIYGKVIIT